MSNCISCKQPIVIGDNVFTPAGIKEVPISGICEICFDDCSLPIDDNIDRLDNNIINLCYEGVVLAGGALRKLVDSSDVICDYDLFVTDTDNIPALRDELSGWMTLIFECPEGKLFSYKDDDGMKVQIINNRVYEDVHDIIGSFDIIAGCAAYTDGVITKHQRFVSNVLNKRLEINKVEYPLATLNRITKYVQKGYRLTRKANTHFIHSVNEMEINELNGRFYID